VDPSSKAVSVRVLAPNTTGVLRRDMFVRVEIRSGSPHTGVLVPTAAVLRNEENLPFVFVTAKTGAGFQRRRVELGSRVGDQYEISGGLAVGDTVVGNGALFLQFAESQ
jgi:cobalt-zinc-cadmium efflux system membrane fusion protein